MKFFGTRHHMWLEVSKELGAHYEPGGFFKTEKVILPYRNFKITLDWYNVPAGKGTVPVTRIRAPFISMQPFFVTISPKPFRWFVKLFGMKSIRTHDEFFDEQFLVQGSPEELVTSLLNNDIIRGLLANKKGFTFKVMDNKGHWSAYPSNVDLISFTAPGLLNDKEQLKDLFALFTYALDELSKMGCASTDDPHMKL